MAIYIKGMDMPKEKAVDLTISPNGGVIVWKKGHYIGPIQQLRATEVPEPHGRLIDADFEESHYRSMIVAPTPDVTVADKIYADRIATALHMAKTVIEGSNNE